MERYIIKNHDLEYIYSTSSLEKLFDYVENILSLDRPKTLTEADTTLWNSKFVLIKD